MKCWFVFTGLLLLLFAGCGNRSTDSMKPAEWFFLQRAYPEFKLNELGYQKAMLTAARHPLPTAVAGWSAPWLLEGPVNTGGRVNCIAVHPQNNNIMLAGNASGGIFKTDDGGLNWYPVFDDKPWIAISCILFEPGNPMVLYAGTGDKNISITPFIGDGIYKSTDGGNTWFNTGLADQRIISKIVIDPVNTNNIYAAAMGLPFEKNNHRGVYKSVDGGLNWTQSLFVNDSTGAIDLLINPVNPQILYAATWNRIRNNHQTLVAGPDAGIYKSSDGGTTWNKLTGGLPGGDMSRIGLAMSGSDPDRLWAVYVNDALDMEGIYKTIDGGATWNQINDPGQIMGGFGWYFGRIEVNPTNDNELWVCGVDLWKSNDDGSNWNSMSNGTHADNHDLAYISGNTWILATDGGIYQTTNGGSTWDDIDLIPNNQFYRITWNPHNSGEYAGGVQDNGTNTGNALQIANWQKLFGADGFQMRYNTIDAQINYVEIQNGEIFASIDGGSSYFPAGNGIDFSDRRGWDMPYILNPDNPDELYTGTYRIYVNFDGVNANWTPISPDLTDGIIFGDRFHTISALAQSSVNNDHLMAGTSDGNVWNTPDGGTTWTNITQNLPDRFVTSVHYSDNFPNTAFVTHSGYKDNDFIPHIHRTNDNGATWIDISGNLPQLAINDMVSIGSTDSILFAATDAGVYGTADNGNTWSLVGSGMPAVAIFDIDYDPLNNKLLAGTFGRSMWSFALDSIITFIQPSVKNEALKIYPVPATDIIYINRNQLKEVSSLSIYDAKGELVRSEVVREKYDVKNLRQGTYYIVAQGKRQFFGTFVKY